MPGALRVILAFGVLVLAGCSRKGAIEGDVYFSGTRGEPIRAAGVSVLLLHGGDSAMAAVDRLCSQYVEMVMRLRLAEITAMDSVELYANQSTSDVGLQHFARYAPIANAAKDSVRRLSEETLSRV